MKIFLSIYSVVLLILMVLSFTVDMGFEEQILTLIFLGVLYIGNEIQSTKL